MSKTSTLGLIVIVLCTILGCKKDKIPSAIKFTETCDFTNEKTELLHHVEGTLKFTAPKDQIEYAQYIISIPNHLPMVVCNMPTSFKMELGESKKVVFSGLAVILPEEIDATGTHIQLHFLKME